MIGGMLRFVPLPLVTLPLVTSPAHAYAPLEHAIGVHLSTEGLDRLGQAIADVMPVEFPVGALSGALACDDADPTQTLSWSLEPLTVDLDIQDVALVPSEGRLDLALYGALASSASSLVASGDCAPLVDLEERCTVELPTVAIEVHIPIYLRYSEGAFDAAVGAVSLVLPPITNPLDECLLADAIGTLIGLNPEAITALLADAITPSLDDLGPTIEAALENGLGALVMDTSLAMGDGEIALSIAPSTFTLNDAGLFIGLGATLSPTTVSDCVAAGVAPSADAAWPPLEGTAPDDALEYDVGLVVATPFVDQLLTGVYQSGALCIDLADLGGAPLDTSLFVPIFGEPWEDLFPEAAAMTLAVRPAQAPTAAFASDGAALRIGLDGLGIRAYAPLDGREVRVFAVSLTGSIGVDLALESGTLTPTIVVDDALGFSEDDTELLPAGYAEGLAAFVPALLGSVLPELPTIAIPSWQGIGLGWIWWMPDDDWLGGYAVLDIENVAPIELSGCAGGSVGCDGGGLSTEGLDLGAELGCDSESGGCADSAGCAGGTSCTATPLCVRGLPLLIGLLVPIWRRKR